MIPSPHKITICDLEVFYRVGVPAEERRQEQRLLLHIEMGGDFSQAIASGSIADTTDYFAVVQRLKRLGEGREWVLIESLAAEIADLIRAEFQIPTVTVEVKKFIIPETRYVSVTVTRG